MCDRDSQTNQGSWRISWKGNEKVKSLVVGRCCRLMLCNVYWSAAFLSASFSNALISSLAASRYFSTFLITFRAIVWSLLKGTKRVLRNNSKWYKNNLTSHCLWLWRPVQTFPRQAWPESCSVIESSRHSDKSNDHRHRLSLKALSVWWRNE